MLSRSLLVDDLADLLSGAIEVFVVEDVQLLLFAGNHLLSDVGVGALQAKNHRLVERVLLVGADDGGGEVVASEDSTEDVHKDSFDLGVVVEELEGLGQCIALCAATDIKEVSRLTTVELDDIHGGHGETSAVDEAADVTSDVNIIKIKALGVLLTSVILSFIFDGCEVLLAEESVRIDGDLAVSCKHLALLG